MLVSVRILSKLKSIFIFLCLGIFFACCSSCGSDDEKGQKTFENMTLEKFKSQTREKKRNNIEIWLVDQKILPGRINSEKAKQEEKDLFYQFQRCVSEYVYTKSASVELSQVLDWCKNEYQNNKKRFESHVYLDDFFDNFSPFDGSYRPLEAAIKKAMNDPDSYKHDETKYALVLSGKEAPHAIVMTTFRGKNAFGGMVKQTVKAKVDLKTLAMTEVK